VANKTRKVETQRAAHDSAQHVAGSAPNEYLTLRIAAGLRLEQL
jgi:hypothetical protein